MNSPRFGRNSFVYILVILAIIILFVATLNREEVQDDWSISRVAEEIKKGNVDKIVVEVNNNLLITLKDDTVIRSQKDANSSAVDQFIALGVTHEELTKVDWENRRITAWQTTMRDVLFFMFPTLLILGVLFFMMRQAQGTNNQAMSFGKSRARMFSGDQPTVTFDDVAGCDEAKEELSEVVEFLKEPDKFILLGARIPKGVLLVGAPGTGKTLLAKAVSGEAGVPFFSISGSEFVEMFVGVGASRVRDLFEQAKRHSPCIVFIDEIDAVGRHRGAGLGGSHDEREQTLNQILVEMDGFDTDTNVIIVAATNRPDILDPALLRPGRFDRRVVIDRPDVRGREGILKVHVRGKPLGSDVDLKILAKATPGFAGADIENMINEGAILAARRNKRVINMPELQEAIERVVMGPERRSRLLTPEDRRVTAYHEAGHALLGHLLPRTDPVLKVTIIPRGMALGYMMPMGDDSVHMTRAKFLDTITMILGGRVAEELVFDDITTGASNDLEQATKMARNMVTRYGMSERLGPMVYGQKEEMVFLGREIGEQRDYSESVAEEIDEEVRRIVSEAYSLARNTLIENNDKLEVVAQTLLDVETLDRHEFLNVMEGKPIDAPRPAEEQPTQKKVKSKKKKGGGEDASSQIDLPPAPAPA